MAETEAAEAAPGARGLTRGYVLLALAAFLFFGWFAHGYIENSDARITLHAARAWALRGDPSLVRAEDAERLVPGMPTWPAEQFLAGAIHGEQTGGVPLFGMPGRDGRGYLWFPIGHQLLLVPCVWLGELFASWAPEPERRLAAENDPVFRSHWWEQFCASFLPAGFHALSFVLLVLLGTTLGLARRESLLLAVVLALSTQWFGSAAETLSDGPGACFLYGAALGVAGYCVRGGAARTWLFGAGLAGGMAVLVRYPHALPLTVFGVWAAVHAYRSRRLTDLTWFALGGLPALAFLLWINHHRFGSVMETGYTDAAGWGTYPFLRGIGMLLASPGKGLLFLTPLLIPALWCLRKRQVWSAGVVAAFVAFVLPLYGFANLHYWFAGQSWGNRYMMPMALLLLVFVLSVTRPWRHAPRSFWAVVMVGAVLNLGGMITPYRGYNEMVAATVQSQEGRASTPVDLYERWEFSPIVGHWRYAAASAAGELEPGAGGNPTGFLFDAPTEPPAFPSNPEDRSFRHFWFVHLPRYWPGFPILAVAAAWWVGFCACLWGALRRLLPHS